MFFFSMVLSQDYSPPLSTSSPEVEPTITTSPEYERHLGGKFRRQEKDREGEANREERKGEEEREQVGKEELGEEREQEGKK